MIWGIIRWILTRRESTYVDDPVVEVAERWPSLDIVHESVKLQIADQSALVSTLDNKAGISIGAATILAGVIASLSRDLAESQAVLTDPLKRVSIPLTNWDFDASQTASNVLVATVVIYIAVVVTGFQAYRLRGFRAAPEVERMIDLYLYCDPVETKAAFTHALANAYQANNRLIEWKTRWVSAAITAVAIEAILALVISYVQYEMI